MQNIITSTERKHVPWIDMIRVITMLLVIIGHSTYNTIVTDYGGITHLSNGNICTTQNIIQYIVNFIYTFHMPMFMAVSGACMALGTRKAQSFSSFIKGKANRLLLPFIFTTLLLSIPIKYLSGYYDTSTNVPYDMIMGQVFLFGNSHLWFLVSLFLCFVTFWCIRRFFYSAPLLTWSALLLMSCSSFIIYGLFKNGFGICGCVKYMLYFSVGYFSVNWMNSLRLSWATVATSIIANVLFFANQWFTPPHLQNIPYLTTIIKQLSSIILALWGCFNLTMICKLICSRFSNIASTTIFQQMLHHNYSLYLYSDPAN